MTRIIYNELSRVQETLEQMPCGGIGPNGATEDDLDEAAAEGRHYGDDAMYHTAQQAWLQIERIKQRLPI